MQLHAGYFSLLGQNHSFWKLDPYVKNMLDLVIDSEHI
jgi:hypothetical protein